MLSLSHRVRFVPQADISSILRVRTLGRCKPVAQSLTEAAVPDSAGRHLVPAVRRLLLSMLCRLRCLWRLRRLRPVGTAEATATAGTGSEGQP